MSYVHHVRRSDGSHKLACAEELSQGRGDGSKIRKKNTCSHKQVHEPRCPGAENTDWKGGWWLNVSRLKCPLHRERCEVWASVWWSEVVPKPCCFVWSQIGHDQTVLPKSGRRVLKLLWVEAPTVISRLRVTWSTEFPFYSQNQYMFPGKSYITPPAAPVCRTGQNTFHFETFHLVSTKINAKLKYSSWRVTWEIGDLKGGE